MEPDTIVIEPSSSSSSSSGNGCSCFFTVTFVDTDNLVRFVTWLAVPSSAERINCRGLRKEELGADATVANLLNDLERADCALPGAAPSFALPAIRRWASALQPKLDTKVP